MPRTSLVLAVCLSKDNHANLPAKGFTVKVEASHKVEVEASVVQVLASEAAE